MSCCLDKTGDSTNICLLHSVLGYRCDIVNGSFPSLRFIHTCEWYKQHFRVILAISSGALSSLFNGLSVFCLQSFHVLIAKHKTLRSIRVCEISRR